MNAVALLGEYSPDFRPHVATTAALQHSCDALGVQVAADCVSTADADSSLFSCYSGIWVAPGSPYRRLARTLETIRYGRQQGIPCFGTCGGFQHMVLEYARNVLQFTDAQHAEYDPYASNLFISQLACSLSGREMALSFVPGSRVAEAYGQLSAREQYYCNFGVNPQIIPLLGSGPLRISGSDEEGAVRVIELPSHPFFVGTLFVPQVRSLAAQPHPLVNAFVMAVVNASSVHR